MSRRMAAYVGNMLSSQECHALDTTGIPCGQPTIVDAVIAPLCHAHALAAYHRLEQAISEVPR